MGKAVVIELYEIFREEKMNKNEQEKPERKE